MVTSARFAGAASCSRQSVRRMTGGAPPAPAAHPGGPRAPLARPCEFLGATRARRQGRRAACPGCVPLRGAATLQRHAMCRNFRRNTAQPKSQCKRRIRSRATARPRPPRGSTAAPARATARKLRLPCSSPPSPLLWLGDPGSGPAPRDTSVSAGWRGICACEINAHLCPRKTAPPRGAAPACRLAPHSLACRCLLRALWSSCRAPCTEREHRPGRGGFPAGFRSGLLRQRGVEPRAPLGWKPEQGNAMGQAAALRRGEGQPSPEPRSRKTTILSKGKGRAAHS